MRLTDLEAQWITRNGERVGIVFRCPHCLGKAESTYLTCFKMAAPKIAGDDPDSQFGLLAGLVALPRDYVVPCKPGIAWTFTGDTFDTLSITPSLDASASGHWHGYVTNGDAS